MPPPIWEVARVVSRHFPELVFVGGTALAECYLKHRYSEDVDFASSQLRHTRDVAGPLTAVFQHEGWPSEFLEMPVGATSGYVKHPELPERVKVQVATLPLLNEKIAARCGGVRVAAIENLRDMKLDALANFDRDEIKDIFDLWRLHEILGPPDRPAIPTSRSAALVGRLKHISAKWRKSPPEKPGWYIGRDWKRDRTKLASFCDRELSEFTAKFQTSALRPVK